MLRREGRPPRAGIAKDSKKLEKIADVTSFEIISLSPLLRHFVVIRWCYVQFYDIPMRNFGTGEIKSKCKLTTRRRGTWRLSSRDNFFFGFYLKYGYRLLFKCISDGILCELLDSSWYQLGFLAFEVPNSMIIADVDKICKKHGYGLNVVNKLNWGVVEYQIECNYNE